MRGVVAIGTAGVALLAASATLDVVPRLVWNASETVPIGLYAVAPHDTPQPGDLVLVAPPAELMAFLAARGYLADGLPMLKRVAALEGQVVCRADDVVSVDGSTVALALARDSRGRPLPAWSGCRTLGADDVLLLNPRSDTSFDSRYVGPMPRDTLLGRAVPIWTVAP